MKRGAFNLAMKTIAELRRENLLRLIAEFETQDKVSELSDVSQVYLSQIKNQSADYRTGRPRQMGSRTARTLELGCGKPIGWMDTEHLSYATAEDSPMPAHTLSQVVTLPQRVQEFDLYTRAAIELMQSLDIGQRHAMLARMREFQQYLDPPKVGQAL